MPFGLYLHYPFCRNRCSYCDFYKELYDQGLEKRFFDALNTETDLAASRYASGRKITSIFIGGGTPSLASRDLLTDWWERLNRRFEISRNLEFSIETNPESVTLDLLEFYRDLGVNRPLFGIQSFNRRSLKLLDRRHRPHDSHRAVYHANALGFDNFGVDLIYGLPRQRSKSLAGDLDQIIDLEPPHISFYQLTVEPGTVLARRLSSGELRLPDQELVHGMYRGGVQQLTESGYNRYEVSSFARPGFECRHNIGYWEGDEYLGLGPSAHSFIEGVRFANRDDVGVYLEELRAGRLPHLIDESGAEERMTEAIMLGLRTSQGINRRRFSQRFGVKLEERLDRSQYRILVESGHLLPERGRLRLSDEGFYLADEITRRLLK